MASGICFKKHSRSKHGVGRGAWTDGGGLPGVSNPCSWTTGMRSGAFLALLCTFQKVYHKKHKHSYLRKQRPPQKFQVFLSESPDRKGALRSETAAVCTIGSGRKRFWRVPQYGPKRCGPLLGLQADDRMCCPNWTCLRVKEFKS